MTDRVSKIVLRGDISDLQAKMVAAGKSVSAFGDKVTQQDKKSAKFRQGLTSVGDAAGKMGLVAAAGLAAVVATTANFDKQMSAVKAATHESANAMEQLRAAAIKAGADTAFSASEAAAGIENLAKAGVQTKDILGGGLQGALDLAAAGQTDVAFAAEAAATAMTQFGLAGKDVPHIADLLAAGAGKAQGEVSDMAAALNQGGLVANQMGLSIEETTGALAAFASAGLVGSDAGTSLKTMLQRLQAPIGAAASTMKELNLSAYDAQGNFIGMANFAAQLQDRLKGMTDQQRNAALATIFGSDAVRAAGVVYTQGADGIQKWVDNVNDQGYAAETAATKLDNLAGDMEAFKGSLETALIGSGEGSQGALRSLVQGATGVVNAFSKIPAPAQNAATALLAVTAVTGSSLWFGSKVLNGITDARAALDNLGAAGTRTAGALGAMGKAASTAGILLAGIAAQDLLQGGGLDKSLPTINELTNTLNGLTQSGAGAKGLTKNYDDLADAIDRIGDPNKAQALQDSIAGVIGFGGGDDVKNYRAEIDALDGALANIASTSGAPAAKSALAALAEAKGLDKGQTKDLLALLPSYRDALAGTAASTDDAKVATEGLTAATGESTSAEMDNAKALGDALKAREELTNASIEAFDAETAYQRALNEGKDRKAEKQKIQDQIAEIKKGGVKGDEKARLADLESQLDDYRDTLDKTTVAGQKNRDILSDQAKAWNGLAAKQKDAKGAYAAARDALISQAMQFGATRREAKRYADKLLDVPPRITTKIILDKQKAEADLAAIKTRFDAIKPKTVKITFKAFYDASVADANRAAFAPPPGSTPTRRAAGGYIAGPGTGTSDSIPAYLSNGEFVIKAAAVARYGQEFLSHINSMRFADGGYVDQRAQRAQMRGYAGGGYVTGAPSPGLSSGDVDRIAGALAGMRPLYGDVHVQDGTGFRQVLEQDRRNASVGARSFRR